MFVGRTDSCAALCTLRKLKDSAAIFTEVASEFSASFAAHHCVSAELYDYAGETRKSSVEAEDSDESAVGSTCDAVDSTVVPATKLEIIASGWCRR